MEMEKERQGLGLSLAGNRDRSRLSIFVVGLHPGGPAARDGRIRVGDELLEVRPVHIIAVTSWCVKLCYVTLNNVSSRLQLSDISRALNYFQSRKRVKDAAALAVLTHDR